MNGVCAFSLSEPATREFVELLRSFDANHQGSIIQVLTDAAPPPDLGSTFARIAPWSPVVDPRRFGFDRDSD